MGLRQEYQGLYDSAFIACTHIERAHPAGVLRAFLAEQVREDLRRRENAVDSADTSGDVSDDFAALARIVTEYERLCRAVFSDLHHVHRPEPPWRVLAPGRAAVRAPLQVRRRRPVYALRVRADVAEQRGLVWEFQVFQRMDGADDTTEVVTGLLPHGSRDAEAAWDRVLPEWCDELDYGFQALGLDVSLPLPPGPRS
ncbi:hypothetical protein [Streptodolium elevatio]|uniref:Uncharacterized protein n=1 Tax=Streptodolium elevatio TaxID=3157996 RepID=A0ABV3DQ81_9ACTN